MDEIKELEKRLKAKKSYQLDVVDFVTEKKFHKGVNQEYLDKHHNGSLTAYLQSLKEKGFQKIQLEQKTKYGASSQPAGITRTVDFRPASEKSINQKTTSQMANSQMANSIGLNGTFGLGMPEIMDGFAAKRELELLRKQYEKLEKDFKEERELKREWREKAEKAERNNDKYELKQELSPEPSALDKIINSLASNPATIPSLVSAFKGGGVGLGQPQLNEANPFANYTEMQLALCDMIGLCPDNFCEQLANLISRVSEKDEDFIQKLKTLMETPNLNNV